MKTSDFVLFTILITLTTTNLASARIINIPEDHETIQAGIDASEDGDTVLVSEGLYEESIDFNGKAILVTSTFPENIGAIWRTIIHSDGDRAVHFENDEDEQSQLRGIWIRSENDDQESGGIICRGSSPTIRNCLIFANYSLDGAGLLCLEDASPILMDCEISGNLVEGNGGAVFCNSSSPVFEDCIIEDNLSELNGGAIYCEDGSDPVLNRCEIMGNRAIRTAGVFYSIDDSDIEFNMCLLYDNTPNIFISLGSDPVFFNSTFSTNRGEPMGYVSDNTYLTITNCIIWGNRGGEFNFDRENAGSVIEVNYSDIQDGEESFIVNNNGRLNWGDGNIDADPNFIDPREDDFHLLEDSPCIDAGDPDSPEDPDDTRADMGALYFHQVQPDEDGKLYVPDEYETIQEAINTAQDGDSVIVAPGEYIENINFLGKAITVIGDPDDPSAVTIDGNREGTVVEFENNEDENSILTGLTITNGDSWLGGGPGGGGIHITDANPTLQHLIISNNNAVYGCGIYISNSSPLLDHLTITENISQLDGGGIFIRNSPGVVIQNCLIYGNSSTDRGGGLFLQNSDAINIIDSEFTNNQSRLNGGGIWTNSEITLQNVLIDGNSSQSEGGGFAADSCRTIQLINCTFVRNISEQGSSGILDFGSELLIQNSIFWMNAAIRCGENEGIEGLQNIINVNYSSIEDGQDSFELGDVGRIIWGDDNIDDAPLFVNADENDYHLTADSPCIDTGDPGADFDPDGTRADIGAFYFHQLDIDVSPINIEFPAIEWGEWDSVRVNIINTGGTDLSILEIQYPLHMAHVFLQDVDPDDLPIVIQPEDTLTLYAYNHPDPRAMRSSFAIIVSDDPDEPEITIEMIADVLSADNEELYPAVFGLSTPFPNPFNAIVTLNYTLPIHAHTSIRIYDLSGRLVESLVNRQLPAGSHKISWEAGIYTSGMYFVKMEALDFSVIRKIILTP